MHEKKDPLRSINSKTKKITYFTLKPSLSDSLKCNFLYADNYKLLFLDRKF